MAADDAQRQSRILVVGDPDNSFVTQAVHLAGQYGLAVTSCDDVYAAAAELARAPERFMAVAGLFGRLAAGHGDFFALVCRRGVPCCCLLDARRGADRRRAPAAIRRGVHVVGDPAEMREFLEAQLPAADGRPCGRDELALDDCRASEAEIKALLRQETDE